jgi:hypothetical protein
MSYQSWSVVFSEQPSAAKWNILGTNDSTFNTLLGTYGVRNPYCFSAWASGGTTISDGAWTKIALATEEYDYNSNFASSTYTAPVAGVYHFDGSWQVGSISTGTLFASSVYKNGALFKQTNTPPLSNGASGIHCDILLAANDTVEFYAFQESAGTEAVITVQESTWFSGHLVHAV